MFFAYYPCTGEPGGFATYEIPRTPDEENPNPTPELYQYIPMNVPAVQDGASYYNYQILMLDPDGVTHRVPEEGSFFQTENRYQAFVYYKGIGARTWRLVGFQEVCIK